MTDDRNTSSGMIQREVDIDTAARPGQPGETGTSTENVTRPRRPAGERPRRPRPEGERPRRPEGERPRRTVTADGTAVTDAERPRRPRPEGERPRRPEGERPRRTVTTDGTAVTDAERPRRPRPEGERPRRPEGERPRRTVTADGTAVTDAERPRRPRPEGERPRRPEGDRPRPAGDRPRRKRKLSPEEIAIRRKKKRIKKIKKAVQGFGIVAGFLAGLVIVIVILSMGLAKAMKGLMLEDKPMTTASLGDTFGKLEEPLTEEKTEETTQYPTFQEPESYSADAMREKGVPDVLIEFYEKYPEVAPYSWFYPEKSKISYDMDITKDVIPGRVTYLCQWDERWGYKEFGNSYFGVAGCGPTCICMVYSGLTGKTDKNPYTIGLELAEREYYIPGSGTTWEAMNDIPQEYGLEVIDVPCYEEDIRNTLKEGHPIICNVVPGDFTQVGHYIVLTGIDDNDQLSICDPNSPERSSQKWDLERVIVQIDALWGYAYYGE